MYFFLGKYSFLYFWLHWVLAVACGILAPSPGIKPVSPALKGSFLTTGPPGKSPSTVFLPINCYRGVWYTERLKTKDNSSETVANTMWNRTISISLILTCQQFSNWCFTKHQPCECSLQKKFLIKKKIHGFQWLQLHTSNVGDTGLIPVWGTMILHAARRSQKTN